MAAVQTASNPSELPGLIGQAQPGDRIELAAGLYSGQRLVLRGHGQPGAPIVIAAAQPGACVMAGNSEIRLDGHDLRLDGFYFSAGGHIRLTGERHALRDIAIEEGPTPPEGDTKWLSLYGREHTVEHCYLAGKKNPGTTLVVWLEKGAERGRHRIARNHFGFRPPLGQNGGETLRIGDSSTSLEIAACVIEDNLFERCNGEIEIISNKSCGNLYRGNTFRGCAGTLTLRHGNVCRVIDNVFLGAGEPESGGVRIIGEDHWVEGNVFAGLRGKGFRAAISLVQGVANTPLNGYAQVRRAIVTANDIWDCAEAIARSVPARGATLEPEDCWIASNLIDSPMRPRWEEMLVRNAGPSWRKK
jgi:poly(beta-D-mannuronate) lyase